jgi:hypothetical protein
MISTGRVACDSDYIHLDVPIDFLGFFIHVKHLPVGRNSGSQTRHRNLLEVEDS